MLSYRLFKRIIERKAFVRYKHKQDHWSVQKKKNFPIDKALNHFDDFYKQVFATQWPAIRQGLLSKQKYVAIVNNYSDAERISTEMEHNGALNVRRLFELEKQYIQEKIEKNRRIARLETIWKLDKATEVANEVAVDENKPDKSDEAAIKKKSFSLESSLESAELDTRRQIDSRDELSAEILHQFIPATKIKGMEDFVPESDHYKYYDNTTEFSVKIDKEYHLNFPEHLNVYCFEESNQSDFDPAKKGSTGVLDYYLMDGASILPVLALDLKPGQRMLDVCAAPGGKSLLALQTLHPDYLVCNDSSMSRVNRIYNVLHQFLYDLEEKWIAPGRIKVTTMDGRNISDTDFDCILVDVPCTNDRHSLKENENNIFKPSRVKERLKIPELQCQILVQALKNVKKGGVVVYSTCSLSPIQNDGVVHMALKQIWEDTKLEFIVKDLSPAMVQTRSVFRLASPKLMKYGQLVLPDSQQNYGPMYFCKLQRLE